MERETRFRTLGRMSQAGPPHRARLVRQLSPRQEGGEAGEPETFSPFRFTTGVFDLARKCPGQISGEGRYPEF
jgi:hypothetical protein